MDMQALRKKKTEEIRKLVAEKREALRKFRFSAAGAQVRNTKEGRALRRDIARMLTLLRERATEARAAEEGAAPAASSRN